MPKFNTEVQHSLGKDKAIERLRSFSDRIREQYAGQVSDMEESWNDDGLNFGFSVMGMGIGGSIKVDDTKATVDGNLPIAAAMFRGKIESEIKGHLEDVLA